VDILACSPFKEEKMTEEAKQAILDFIKIKKGKTKHYYQDLCKAVPNMEMPQVRKIINEMINDGQLKYWSSDSTTLYFRIGNAESDK
jgi:hypothetical protein